MRILIVAICVLSGFAQARAGRSHAIVVGIDEYAGEEFPTLRNAENDARATEATFGVRFSMDFHYKDGRSAIREHNVKECYKAHFNKTDGRWQIIS